MSRPVCLLLTVTAALVCTAPAWAGQPAVAGTVFDASDATPLDEKQVLPQYVTFRPGDGQVCEVNPPRFVWPYVPGVVPKGRVEDHTFRLQIASDAGMKRLTVDEAGLKINFYNALPVLGGGGPWYWRVGYDVGTPEEKWSRVRQFTLAGGAMAWDRTAMKDLAGRLKGHPRVLLNAENTDRLLAAGAKDPALAMLRDRIRSLADRHLRSRRHGRLSEKDTPDCGVTSKEFSAVGQGVELCAWAWSFTGNRKYLDAKEDALRLASYPPGGVSTPEGRLAPRGQDKWPTQITQSLAIFLDRCWDELSEGERERLIASVDWRIRANLDQFSWRQRGRIASNGLAVWPSSHPYQAAVWTLGADVAAYEHSPAAREHAWIVLNYLVGVTGGAGGYESYNEGAGYGNWKFETTVISTLLWNLTVPDLKLHLNPYYARVSDFLSRLSPVGTYRSSFGNQGYTAYADIHATIFREMAMMTGRGEFLANWEACHRFRKSSQRPVPPRPLHLPAEYVMLATRDLPRPHAEAHATKLFNVSGWVMTAASPPSAFDRWRENVGMTFHCRPRGGYSHSFKSENAFDLYAYGRLIAVGGATAVNRERLQHDTMSHNAVLIDGRGQEYNFHKPERPMAGRIVAFAERDGVVYFSGDATWAYPNVKGLAHCLRHVLFVDGKCFLIVDDIGMREDVKPARYTWLWHFLPKAPLDYDRERCELRYTMDGVHVLVRHLGNEGNLEYRALIGPEEGSRNPITGKDYYRNLLAGAKEKNTNLDRQFTQTNIWLTTVKPSRTGRFVAVVLPWKDGMDEPAVESLSGGRLRVAFPGLAARTFAFRRGAAADVVVDVAGVREACSNEAVRDRIRLPKYASLPKW